VLGELALDADRHSIALHPAPRKGRQLRTFMAGLRTCRWIYQKQSAAEFLEDLLRRPARYWWAQGVTDVTHDDTSAG
jgi:hypothetical protein